MLRRARKDLLDANESLFGSENLHQIEIEIIKMAQEGKFSAELRIVTSDKLWEKCDDLFPKSSKNNQLDLFLNSNSKII